MSKYCPISDPASTSLRLLLLFFEHKEGILYAFCRLRPYHAEYTSSRPITEVKQRRACPVLGWVTAWEQQVL